MTRTSLVITGLVGVAGAVGLTAVCMLVVIWGWLPVFLDNPLLTWSSLFAFVIFFAGRNPGDGLRDAANGRRWKSQSQISDLADQYRIHFFRRDLRYALHFIGRISASASGGRSLAGPAGVGPIYLHLNLFTW